MKKSILRIVTTTVMLVTSIIWFSCTKEEEARGSIYGIVTDYATGQPIGNVNVRLRPSGETTLTGNNGAYEFKNLDPGNYSLLLSKAEYADFDDDSIIVLEAGKSMPRDIQMRKLMASLLITDMSGDTLNSLDFGSDEYVTSKSFNIFNNGTITISCQMFYSCIWIDTAIAAGATIAPGQTMAVTVIIDRSQLSSGENRTYLHIISNNGNNELLITATGPGAPTVTTNAVSSLTATSAVCGGNVTTDCGCDVTDRGLCWATFNAPSLENGSHLSNGTGTGTFSSTMSNLTPNTVYYVRAFATNVRGTSYGEERQFTTNDGMPTVTINAVTNITATSAVCGGNINSNGGFAVTDKGLVWSTSQYPTMSDNHISLGSGDTPFSGSMTNLLMGTAYYVRAYATNSQGTSYSTQLLFTTHNGLPTVTTTAVTMVGDTLLSGGNVISDGGFPVTSRGVCYGSYPYPDLSSSYFHTSNGTGTGSFVAILNQPVTGTIYVRAYATNENGTIYGNQVTVNVDYFSLPTFTYNGHIYRVAPDPGNTMDWTVANVYCNNYSIYGVTGWRMPTREELVQMYADRNQIGGFTTTTSSATNTIPYCYWSSTASGSNSHYYVSFVNGHVSTFFSYYYLSVRPVHIEQ